MGKYDETRKYNLKFVNNEKLLKPENQKKSHEMQGFLAETQKQTPY